MTLLQAALEYAALGWAIHPLQPGDKRPLVKDYPQRRATPDLFGQRGNAEQHGRQAGPRDRHPGRQRLCCAAPEPA
jgi:hypothetical protein